MEVEEKLQKLIERAWALHDNLSDEIQQSCAGFGGFCPQHNQYGGFADDPFAERRSLTAIRDALEALENLLLYIQRLQSQQCSEQYTALTRVEESRLFLIKKMREHPGNTPEVIQELFKFVGNKNFFNQDHNIRKKEKGNGSLVSLRSCRQILVYPWELLKAATTGIRLPLIAVSVVYFIHFYQSRTSHIRRKKLIKEFSTFYGRRDNSLLNPTSEIRHLSGSSLDVLYGRG